MSELGEVYLHAGSEPLPGYRLLIRLGKGGFGEVWKAEAPGGFEVALKFVDLHEGASSFEVRSLEVIKRIHHPHLLTPTGAWQLGKWLVIGMEIADGSSMDRFREAVSQGHPGIPVQELTDYMMEAAKGIDFLNDPRPRVDGTMQGIQHRDIKPQNILLVGGGVKVADFGLVRLLENSLTSHSGAMTPAYAAPEFFKGETSKQSDQYSLAVTYCFLRSGKLPFKGNNYALMLGHTTREPDLIMLPEAERPVVARALVKQPKGRWLNCRVFIAELQSARSNNISVRSNSTSRRKTPLQTDAKVHVTSSAIELQREFPVVVPRCSLSVDQEVGFIRKALLLNLPTTQKARILRRRFHLILAISLIISSAYLYYINFINKIEIQFLVGTIFMIIFLFFVPIYLIFWIPAASAYATTIPREDRQKLSD